MIYILIGVIIIATGAGMFLYLNYRFKNIQKKYTSLLASFRELDEQAKLIVKTDIELNRAQEELDKRLNGLDALQRISRTIGSSLDKSEILHLIKEAKLSDLGFESFIILLTSENNRDQLECGASINVSSKNVEDTLELFHMHPELFKTLEERRAISTISSTKEGQEFFAETFHTKHFVIVPMIVQKNITGVIIATSHSASYAVTEGDEEIISILGDHIGQTLENAKLFEEAYRASQTLELKVQERTRQLSEALSHLKQISKAKSDFISAVSHELRTPLTSIKGYAAILMAGKVGDIPEQVKDRLAKINKHSDGLVQLINNLLDISRIESGKAEMKFRVQSLLPTIENIHDLLTPQLKEKNIQWQLNVPKTLPEIAFDTSQIERVFINLISNAVKFTPEKGMIAVGAELTTTDIVLSVTDTGIGIKEDDLLRLFNEFYRVENQINQNVKGTGLGLALAKKIVEAHNGRMWAESTYGSGTTFFFSLPISMPEKKSTEPKDNA